MKKIIVASALALAFSPLFTNAALADPIEGMWKTGEGISIKISGCGGQFCVDVMSGEFSGKRSGKLKAQGGKYVGTLKQFSSGISFTGEATLAGSSLKLAAKKFGMVVKRQTWRRQ